MPTSETKTTSDLMPISILRLAHVRPRAEAVLFSVVLSLMFILVYGGCNTLASRRTELVSCYFDWELRIPLVPILIVPYLSIDFFFVASFLLCADSIELRAHAKRIALAILVAGSAFLVFPLTAGYPRPEVRGWNGWLFAFLWSFDKPHNLVPSLHVALASLLWPVYARHRRSEPSEDAGRTERRQGGRRWFVHGWFALIIASPLLTWQHHVIDVATGALLGQLCIFAFPERRDLALARSSPNLRVAVFYGVGSAALAALALALGAWCLLLLWPAASLALITAAYVRGSSSLFRKSKGRLPIATRVVLAPYLFGVFVRRLVYRSGGPFVEAAPGVYRGRLLTKHGALTVRRLGVAAVLDLTSEHAETRAFLRSAALGNCASSQAEVEYLNVPVLDLTEPSRDQLQIATAFIERHARRGGVYVHCALGISRSAKVISDYLASRR